MSDIADLLGGSLLPDQVPDSDGFQPIDAGWYPAEIEKAELKLTSKETGTYVNTMFTILGDKFAGRKLFHCYNIVNPTPMAVEIGIRELAQTAKAIGLASVGDCMELVGKRLMIKVKVDKEEGFEADNKITGFKPLSGDQGTQSAPTAPLASGGAQKQDAPVPTADKKPPWLK